MFKKSVEILVEPYMDGMRIDALLGKHHLLPARNACLKLIQDGLVVFNGEILTSKKEIVSTGDKILVTLNVAQEPSNDCRPIRPNPIPLNVVFEDNYLMVISKQAGLVCHPSPGHIDDTLVNALVARYGYDNLGLLQGEDRPGIVHRLDMDTTGLMLAAHTDEVQEQLQDLIRLRTLDRRYITLVHGYIAADEGQIVAPIARSKKNRLMMAVSDTPHARTSVTTFKTLARFSAGRQDDGYTLLECHLYTGRTHQIRVHMRHIGHPCVGDPLYGKGSLKCNRGLTRQFLHSWYVHFTHPVTGKTIEIKDPLTKDLQEVLQSLQHDMISATPQGDLILPQLFD